MAERSMAPVLKTGNRKVRGFESYFLRGLESVGKGWLTEADFYRVLWADKD